MNVLKQIKRIIAIILIVIAAVLAILAIIYSGGTLAAAIPLIGGKSAFVAGALAATSLCLAAIIDPDVTSACLKKVAQVAGEALSYVTNAIGQAAGAGFSGLFAGLGNLVVPICLIGGGYLLLTRDRPKTQQPVVIREVAPKDQERGRKPKGSNGSNAPLLEEPTKGDQPIDGDSKPKESNSSSALLPEESTKDLQKGD